jgi:hypothetical protein
MKNGITKQLIGFGHFIKDNILPIAAAVCLILVLGGCGDKADQDQASSASGNGHSITPTESSQLQGAPAHLAGDELDLSWMPIPGTRVVELVPPKVKVSLQKGPPVIARDGVYVAYANGIVKDTKTGLEWVAGPDKSTNWDEARSWVQSLNLDGGGWRMPTVWELKGLYKKASFIGSIMGYKNITSLLKTNSNYLWVWSGETKGPEARYMNFERNYAERGDPVGAVSFRAFAVRSRSDG